MLAGGFIGWILDSMRESTIHSQLGHVQVVRPGYLQKGLGDPYSHLLPSDEGVILGTGLPGLKSVAPRLAFSGLISRGDETISFAGEGVEPVAEAAVAQSVMITQGTDLVGQPVDSAILGTGLAANLGAAVGDRVVLLATTAEGGINAVEVTVSGLFATPTKAYDDVFLRVPIELARSLMRVEGSTTWVVLLDDTRRTESARNYLQSILPKDRFEVLAWHELADFYNKTVELFGRQVDVVRLLIALIVILSISNTLSMAVIERTGEIGTSMALGLQSRAVMWQFILEGALLGAVGGIVGVALGVLAASIASYIGIPMPPPPGMDMGFVAAIKISPQLAWDAFVLAFLTTLLASIAPAWKASRMQIVDALRHQG